MLRTELLTVIGVARLWEESEENSSFEKIYKIL
jgi:hypothetical protein